MKGISNFRSLRLVVLGMVAMVTVTSAYGADPKITVVSEYWEGYTNQDGTGRYFDTLDGALGKGSYEFAGMPWKRAEALFESGKFDALMGADGTRKGVYPVWPIDVNAFAVFYSKQSIPTWKNDESIIGKRVLWVRGYDVGKYMPGLKVTEEVTTMEQGFKMVVAGRADVLVDYQADMETLAKRLKTDMNRFEVRPTEIPGGFIYVGFREGPRGKDLAKRFDEGMSRLEKEGKLKPIFVKYGAEGFYRRIIAKVKPSR